MLGLPTHLVQRLNVDTVSLCGTPGDKFQNYLRVDSVLLWYGFQCNYTVKPLIVNTSLCEHFFSDNGQSKSYVSDPVINSRTISG